MSTTNARGAYLAIQAAASADIVKTIAFTAASVARDISASSFKAVVKDDDGTDKTYAQTITDGANGEVELNIPKAALSKKEGECLTYEFIETISGNEICRMHGSIEVFEEL